MAAGLIQLVAKGIEDNYLTGDPQITFFKCIYRRHTNFSIESVCQYFGSTADFGETVNCTLSKSGDLVGKIFLYAEVPAIPKFIDSNGDENLVKKMAWVRNLGHAMILETSIIIGDKLIDKQYGEWMHLWTQLSKKDSKGISKMIGDLPEIWSFTNGKPGFKLWIPLEFWFCRNSGLALPLIALSAVDIKINIVFRKLEDLCTVGPTHSIDIIEDMVLLKEGDYIEQIVDNKAIYGLVVHFDFLSRKLFYIKIYNPTSTKKNFESFINHPSSNTRFRSEVEIPSAIMESAEFPSNKPYRIWSADHTSYCTPKPNCFEQAERTNFLIKPKLIKTCLYVDYVYLDEEERRKFISTTHEYLIEQIQFNSDIGISSNSIKHKLNLNNCCKSFYWVIQLDRMVGPINDLFNYSTSHIRSDGKDLGKYLGKNPMDKGCLMINGKKRFKDRGPEYFNLVEPLEHHASGPNIGINVYSPSIYPEQHQPSSSINMDKIDSAHLDIRLNSSIVGPHSTAKIRSYTISYNILRICFGMCGLVFKNN